MEAEFPVALSFLANTSHVRGKGVHRRRAEEPPFKEYLDKAFVRLPEALPIRIGFSRLLERRASCRQFREAPVSLESVGTLLHWAYGVTRRQIVDAEERLIRPVPSGGALYPLEIYLLARNVEGLPAGVHHYVPLYQALEFIRPFQDPESSLEAPFLSPEYLVHVSAVLIITGVVNRNGWKYGDRGLRLLLIEAGHVAQNLALTAAALGLGSLSLDGYYDEELADLLGVDSGREIPVGCVAIGHKPPRHGF